MILQGILTYNDNAEFELETETGVVNITKLLDEIFTSKLKSQIYIKIMKGNAILFEEDGGLFIHTDNQKIESYFVCGLNLDKTLFFNTGEYVEITIYKRGKTRNYGK